MIPCTPFTVETKSLNNILYDRLIPLNQFARQTWLNHLILNPFYL